MTLTIGINSLIESNVTIHKGCEIGKKCVTFIWRSNVGSEGFGNARDQGQQVAMQLPILEM